VRRQNLVKPWMRKCSASAIAMSAWQEVILKPH